MEAMDPGHVHAVQLEYCFTFEQGRVIQIHLHMMWNGI